MEYLIYIFIFPILYFNYKIVLSDIKNKIIPNKYLGYLLSLLPLYYIGLLFSDIQIHFGVIILQFIGTFLMSFLLYYYSVWSAGDAKYLLVLALFIPHVGILTFIGNIAILTLLYLISYFFYFYLFNFLIKPKQNIALFKSIQEDLSGKLKVFLISPDRKFNAKIVLTQIIKTLGIFFLLFTTIRLIRIYIIEYLSHQSEIFGISYSSIIYFIQTYSVYALVIGVVILIAVIYIIKKLIYLSSQVMHEKYHNGYKTLTKYGIYFVFFSTSIFIFLQYLHYPEEIMKNLKLIFTYYISILILIKIFLYMYKITFSMNEFQMKPISKLKEGDIIDSSYLIKMFGNQLCLGSDGNSKGILYPSPKKYFLSLESRVEKKDIKKLKQIYSIVNKYYKSEFPGSEVYDIKTLKTFAFGGYIFSGFIISVFLHDSVFTYITKNIFDILKMFLYS